MNITNLETAHFFHLKNHTFELAILPWGATEAHNYHLPYGSDTFQSKYISEKIAKIAFDKQVNALVLPAIPYGVNTGQMDIPYTFSINPSTQLKILDDLVNDLKHQQIFKLVIINSHGGNNFIPAIRELSIKYPEVFICTIDYWKVVNPLTYFDFPGDHAGEMETSAMMVMFPELVLPIELAGEGKENKFAIKGLREKWVWAQRKWSEISTDTGVGNPKLASTEKGGNYLNATIEKISEFIIDLGNTDISKIYKTE